MLSVYNHLAVVGKQSASRKAKGWEAQQHIGVMVVWLTNNRLYIHYISRATYTNGLGVLFARTLNIWHARTLLCGKYFSASLPRA